MSIKSKSWISQVISLSGYTYLSQFISLLALPLITRIYSPRDFGIYAVFASALAIVSVFSTWRYHLAIALPNEERSLASLVLGVTLVCSASSIVLAAAIILSQLWFNYTNLFSIPNTFAEKLPYYFLLAFWSSGLSILYSAWMVKKSLTGILGKTRFVQVLLTLSIQLWLGRSLQSEALVIGLIVGQLFSVVFMMYIFYITSREFLDTRHIESARRQLLEYSFLPRSILQTEFINVGSKMVLPIVLAKYFGAHIAGLWYLCNSIFGNPVGTFVGAMWQVIHNKLAALNDAERTDFLRTVHKFACYLLALPTVYIIFFPDVLPQILGEKWSNIPAIIGIYAVLIYANSVSNLTSYWVVFRETRAEMVYNILLSLMPLSVIVIASLGTSSYSAIHLYCMVGTVLYLGLNTYWGRKLGSNVQFFKNFIVSFAVCSGFAIVVWCIQRYIGTLFYVPLALSALIFLRIFIWGQIREFAKS